MEISESFFKGTRSIEISNDEIGISVLPYIGGKIARFYNKKKDFELLFQNKEEKYREANIHDDFSKYDASGFDDCFPNIDAGKVNYKNQYIDYPDHGEIWSSKLDYKVLENKVILFYESKLLPYTFEKRISINGNSLLLDYKIENIGSEVLKGFYTMHCLVNCKEDMIIIFPKETSKIINVTNSNELGSIGRLHPFPYTSSLNNELYTLNKVFPKSANKFEKYYVTDKIEEGLCGVKYPSNNIELEIIYDAKKLPYLGFWVTEGGFRGDYNCALEPSNGFYDSIEIAEKNNKLMKLAPGSSFEFSIELRLK